MGAVLRYRSTVARLACAALLAGVLSAAGQAHAADTRTPTPLLTVRSAGKLPAGWGATDLEAAYRLGGTGGTGQTVAIVTFLDAPTLAGDLGVYRKTYGLPACTGCLSKVNQAGAAKPLPPADPDFAADTTTQADMITAACPHCKTLVVEADDTSDTAIFAAMDTAARLGAQVIVTGFGNREYAGQDADAVHFDHPGHAIVTAAGDEGFTAGMFPAVLGTVTAVGGTTLSRAHNSRGWTETAWGLGGSGCSAYVNKPAWQHDPHCPGRTVADVAAVAQNLAVYDSYTEGGWLIASGTSASAALVAGVFGLAGNAAHTTPGYPYTHSTHLYDITGGTNDLLNGAKCGHDYLCTAKRGYDAPTGLGTPDGPGAF
jgi:subtilase family serine protease